MKLFFCLTSLFLLANPVHAGFVTLYNFSPLNISGQNSDGAVPFAGLLRDSNGNLYGTTGGGGANGGGTAFELSPGGVFTNLHNFSITSVPSSDGAAPEGSLVMDSSGNLYGTTSAGGSGAGNPNGTSPQGTVFKLSPNGTLTTLVNFSGFNGGDPQAGMIKDSSGNFYGSTSSTIFKISSSGTFTNLFSFRNYNINHGTSFGLPSGLVRDSSGNLYGTIEENGSGGYGAVFELSSNGAFSILHSFSGSDGGAPVADLVRDSNGNLYGTTSSFGASGYGTVFKLSPSGTLTTLVNFNNINGANPIAGLLLDGSGNLYGTTSSGGSLGSGFGFGTGTVFKLNLSADTLTTLFVFTGLNGSEPSGDLIPDGQGNLYGTTRVGGSSFNPNNGNDGSGTVFELTGVVPLGPPSGVPEPSSLTLLSLGALGLLGYVRRRRVVAVP